MDLGRSTASPKFHGIAQPMLNRFIPTIARAQAKKPEGIFRGRFGMRASVYCVLRLVGALTLTALPAFAQEPAQTENDALVPEAPLTPEESAMLGNALVFDPAALATPPKKPLRAPGSSGTGYNVSRTQNLDGSSSIVVKQPLQTEWSNSVGADLGPSNSGSAFGQPLPTTRDSTPSGAAWASLGV